MITYVYSGNWNIMRKLGETFIASICLRKANTCYGKWFFILTKVQFEQFCGSSAIRGVGGWVRRCWWRCSYFLTLRYNPVGISSGIIVPIVLSFPYRRNGSPAIIEIFGFKYADMDICLYHVGKCKKPGSLISVKLSLDSKSSGNTIHGTWGILNKERPHV